MFANSSRLVLRAAARRSMSTSVGEAANSVRRLNSIAFMGGMIGAGAMYMTARNSSDKAEKQLADIIEGLHNIEGLLLAQQAAATAAAPAETMATASADAEAVAKKMLASALRDYPAWSPKNKSLLRKCLTPEVFIQLRNRRTARGFTLDRAIQSGLDNQDSSVGLYAGDYESYYLFRPLFDGVIAAYHNGYDPVNGKHERDLDVSHLNGGNPDPEGKFVLSTRIRVGRNLSNYGLSPGITRGERREVEKIVTDGLSTMEGDLKGKYYPLATMTEADRLQLVKDHFLFKKGDRFLESAGCNREWPEGRGIFHAADKRFLVWVNEEDQLRIISMQQGADIRQVFDRLSRAIQALEKKMEFDYDERLGYISSCPTNLGTAMRASVHIKLPLLSKNPKFKEICKEMGLDVRGIHGEHSESEGGVYDISNIRRLGLSEVACVQIMHDGVVKLIEMEKALQKQ